MTEDEKDIIKQEIIEQIKFDSLQIEELTPVVTLKEKDKFELDKGRYVEFGRLCSEMRLQAILDKLRHVDRGQWKDGELYYACETNPDTGLIEISHVWYFGCKFRCLVTGTIHPPRWDCSDWEFEEGNPYFSVSFLGGPAAMNPRSFKFTLTLHAEKYNQDVTGDILPQDVVWTRYTEDSNGDQRLASDTIWATRRGNSGMSIELTEADIDIGSLGVPKVAVFTATVTLRDGEETTASLQF